MKLDTVREGDITIFVNLVKDTLYGFGVLDIPHDEIPGFFEPADRFLLYRSIVGVRV